MGLDKLFPPPLVFRLFSPLQGICPLTYLCGCPCVMTMKLVCQAPDIWLLPLRKEERKKDGIINATHHSQRKDEELWKIFSHFPKWMWQNANRLCAERDPCSSHTKLLVTAMLASQSSILVLYEINSWCPDISMSTIRSLTSLMYDDHYPSRRNEDGKPWNGRVLAVCVQSTDNRCSSSSVCC